MTITMPPATRMALTLMLTWTMALSAKVMALTPVPVRHFRFGMVQGSVVKSATSGLPVFAYYGIPYAEPPVGDLRFKPPVAYQREQPDTVISSTTFRDSCLQVPATLNSMSEDCLHLNVFTPNSTTSNSSSLCKVMVWIHGGGYIVGDALAYIPTDLVADHDVIVVTLHYRLGYLGFLSSGDAASPGNYGLWDQIEALRWVRDNIRAFGGDPDDVTVFGQSSGSASLSALSLSPHANDLFTKVVLQSGTVFAHWALKSERDSVQQLNRLGRSLGCWRWWYFFLGSRVSRQRMVSCLRKLPVNSIMEASPNMFQIKESYDILNFFGDDIVYTGPVIDGNLLPRHPEMLLKDVNYLTTHGVLSRSYIAGTTNDEASDLVSITENLVPQSFTEEGFRKVARYYLKASFPNCLSRAGTDLVDFIYTYPRETTQEESVSKHSFKDLGSDLWQNVPTVKFLSMLAQASPDTPAFHYLFDHYPDQVNNSAPRTGMNHGDDVMFLFDQPELNSPMMQRSQVIDLQAPNSVKVKNMFRGMLTNFAKTGNPTEQNWPRFDLSDRWYMAVTSQAQVRRRLYPQRMALWQDFLSEKCSV